ncbi:uncharacterized protein LOC132601593 [Lycium barbarum]|uniref:uncharacterized protein LOC132601593 n=1 Tax=Lycium barbarum TaxID=112863 RepID=UPI00293EA73D|nr:uncharacterized protein LOC132601593 [Lycium barbarum]
MSCSCRVFDLDRLSCLHARAALSKRYPDTFGDSVHNHSSAYYSTDAYYKAHEGDIVQIPHESKWMIPPYIQGAQVSPPKYVPKLGRKSNKSKKGVLEEERSHTKKPAKRRNKCSLCKQPGHKRITCNLSLSQVEHNSSQLEQNSPQVE